MKTRARQRLSQINIILANFYHISKTSDEFKETANFKWRTNYYIHCRIVARIRAIKQSAQAKLLIETIFPQD